jgi:hypothetical protein
VYYCGFFGCYLGQIVIEEGGSPQQVTHLPLLRDILLALAETLMYKESRPLQRMRQSK